MNGKGDSPRNCYSKQFKDNFDNIKWTGDEIEDRRQSSIHSHRARLTEAARDDRRVRSQGKDDDIYSQGSED